MVGRQISIETALDGYRASATDLFHENVLLRARLKEVEAEAEQLRGQPPTGPSAETHLAGPVEQQG